VRSQQNTYFVLKAVDEGKGTIAVIVRSAGLLTLEELPVAKDAKIFVGPRQRKSQFSELKAGMRISFELATEDRRIVVRGIRAEE
jgi:hypothetical protein